MFRRMSIIQRIRTSVLGVSQKELAAIAETSQGTVSRWETGELHPDLAQLARIRNHVLSLGKRWDDSWFFEAPNSEAAE